MLRLKAILSLALFHLIGLLPLSIARRLGSLLGRISYTLNLRMAKSTIKNISVCLPELSEQEAKGLAKGSLKETGKTAAEICVIWTGKSSPLDTYVTRISGETLVKSLYEENRGLIVLAPHLGNWEILGHYLARLGHVTNLYQPPKIKALDPLIRNSRAKAGCELVPADVKGVAMLLKNLKAGGISGILPDQNPNDRKSGEFVSFFGEPALTIILVYKLMQRTKCKAVFAFAKRVENGFELIFREPPKELYSDNLQQALLAMNKGIEALVMEAPEQYQWEYKRFKHASPNTNGVQYD